VSQPQLAHHVRSVSEEPGGGLAVAPERGLQVRDGRVELAQHAVARPGEQRVQHGAAGRSNTDGGELPRIAAGNGRSVAAAHRSRSKAGYPSLHEIAGREATPTPRYGKQP